MTIKGQAKLEPHKTYKNSRAISYNCLMRILNQLASIYLIFLFKREKVIKLMCEQLTKFNKTVVE
jgi:hypothetical protein